ncbi:adhesin [Variovorax sp. KBW07]|nr:adhesin [Variovorax sp. KBW07]
MWSAPILVTVRPAVLQCTTTTPQVAVPLGSIPKTAFSGIGSTTGTKPLNIDLMCSGGDPGDSKAISITLTDNTNPGNQSTTLSLTRDSIATGVAIQLLQGQTVIGYGPDSNLPGNPGQWSAGNSGAGVFRIPLSARYIQTGATITPGSANGRATFTMSYQ